MYAVAQPAANKRTASSVASIAGTVSDSRGSSFEQDFNKIQLAAARLVAIQEMAKRKGAFSAEDNRIYADSLLELGQAAQSLARLQQSGKIKDFSMLLQPDIAMPQKQPFYPISSGTGSSGLEHTMGEQKVEEVTEQQLSNDDFLPPNTEDPYEDVSDTVAITVPKKDASVAEAKPIGLSIAGEGGVASSKPNAVALSGRNGLAVSAPKATAIAGVSAEEAAAFSVSLPNRNNLVIKSVAVNRLPQRPAYDDYDYSDVAPVRSVSRETPLTRDVTTLAGAAKKPKKPAAAPAGSSGDASVNKWKTVIAEDYAGTARSANPPAAQPLHASNKFILRSDDGRSFYVF